jgi:uncharacterized protein DUF3455
MKKVYAAAFVAAGAVAFQQPARAHHDGPPRVPANIQVPAGNKLFLIGHALGTQNYICLPSATSVAWTLFGPQATLFDDGNRQLITHFASINPAEGLPRPTWQHSRDTSSVWAQAIANSTDTAYVAQGAIPWLLLQWVGRQDGPRGGDTMSATTFIQRLNTVGGVAPATGCASAADVGKRALVSYEADYFFYRERGHDRDED